MRVARLLASLVTLSIVDQLEDFNRKARLARKLATQKGEARKGVIREYLRYAYIRQCRAPGCKKRFFTARGFATACECPANQIKSDCRAKYDSYLRWLEEFHQKYLKARKLPKDPKAFIEQAWKDPETISLFENRPNQKTPF